MPEESIIASRPPGKLRQIMLSSGRSESRNQIRIAGFRLTLYSPGGGDGGGGAQLRAGLSDQTSRRRLSVD